VSVLTDTNGASSAPAITPPHNLSAEQSVLGAILLSDRSLYALVIEEGLLPEDFYRERHGTIYAAMLELYEESEPVDVLTVTDRLRALGKLDDIGGPASVDELTGLVPAAGHARRYAQIVREHALLRRLLKSTYEIQESVLTHTAQPRELVEQAEKAMLEVARDDRRKDFRSVEDILHDELDKLQKLSEGDTSLTGTPSGFEDLDAITGGFQPGNLIIIAARPAMGKSALVCNIAENAAVGHKRPVALFSLEMAEAELAQRFVASQARIKGEELRKGRVAAERWPKIMKASQDLSHAPLWIDDSSDVGLLEVRAKARRLHSQFDGGLGLIIIDYLQLMRTDSRYDSRVTAVGELSRGLKILARELGVPVIALSQLSRAVEQRTDKRPQLSDLRESGNLEQDSDLVMFIYRDEYYTREESERPGEADLIISKHRNGAIGKVTLTFQEQYPRFMSYKASEYGR
jgi:replicative DNA helicase